MISIFKKREYIQNRACAPTYQYLLAKMRYIDRLQYEPSYASLASYPNPSSPLMQVHWSQSKVEFGTFCFDTAKAVHLEKHNVIYSYSEQHLSLTFVIA